MILSVRRMCSICLRHRWMSADWIEGVCVLKKIYFDSLVRRYDRTTNTSSGKLWTILSRNVCYTAQRFFYLILCCELLTLAMTQSMARSNRNGERMQPWCSWWRISYTKTHTSRNQPRELLETLRGRSFLLYITCWTADELIFWADALLNNISVYIWRTNPDANAHTEYIDRFMCWYFPRCTEHSASPSINNMLTLCVWVF